MNKLMKKIILSIMTLLISFSLTFGNIAYAYVANSTNQFHIAVYLDEDTDTYIVYFDNYNSSTCEFALGADGITHFPFLPCTADSDGNKAALIPVGDIATNQYLWVNENVSGTITVKLAAHKIDYSTATVLTSSRAEFLGTTGERIEAEPGIDINPSRVDGQNVIKVTDDSFATIKYQIVKVTNAAYQSLVANAVATQTASEQNPTLAIETMLAFDSGYTTLLPAFADAKWSALPADKMIREPLDTKNGDIYVVWLMGYNEIGNVTYDMQIMYCTVRGIQGADLKVLPKTGFNYAIDALFLMNVVALGGAYLRRRKLVNLINEK